MDPIDEAEFALILSEIDPQGPGRPHRRELPPGGWQNRGSDQVDILYPDADSDQGQDPHPDPERR